LPSFFHGPLLGAGSLWPLPTQKVLARLHKEGKRNPPPVFKVGGWVTSTTPYKTIGSMMVLRLEHESKSW